LVITLNQFIKIDKSYVVFNSFYGKRIDDSPRIIYEKLKEKKNNLKCYWVVSRRDKNLEIPYAYQVKKDSLKHIFILLKSNIWISNSNIDLIHGVMVPKGNRIYINTWHGIPFKVLGELEKFISKDDRNWFKNVKFDYFCACSEYDKSIFKKVFPSSSGNIVTWGLPRDEIKKEFNKEALRKKIGIPDGRRVVLYAPTFRDAVFYERKSKINGLGISEQPKWMQYRLENKFFILYRGHYNSPSTADDMGNYMANVTSYPNIDELMCVSDVLITDYSSILFDFSLLEKPIILFQYDLGIYMRDRGLYLNPSSLGIPVFFTSQEVFEKLITSNLETESVSKIKEKFFPENNCSIEKILNVIEMETSI